jgi:hypothetical protein
MWQVHSAGWMMGISKFCPCGRPRDIIESKSTVSLGMTSSGEWCRVECPRQDGGAVCFDWTGSIGRGSCPALPAAVSTRIRHASLRGSCRTRRIVFFRVSLLPWSGVARWPASKGSDARHVGFEPRNQGRGDAATFSEDGPKHGKRKSMRMAEALKTRGRDERLT